MTAQEFEKTYWKYYLNLEENFLDTEKYVSIDNDNFQTFSIEYLKILQMTCSEIDVVAKMFCKELNCSFKGDNICNYCQVISDKCPDFSENDVLFVLNNTNIKPWTGWAYEKYKNKEPNVSPLWWKDNTDVKHKRTQLTDGILNYKKANQKNVIFALAALFQLELYYYKHLIQDKENIVLIPLPKSKMFSIQRWYDEILTADEILCERSEQ